MKMKKSILNFGKALNKKEQKLINGGFHEQDVEGCWQPSGNTCSHQSSTPGWSYECNINEVCVAGNEIFYGSQGQYSYFMPGTCQCP